MNKDIIIGALVGFGLLTGTVGIASAINSNQNEGNTIPGVQVQEKAEPVIETKTVMETHEEPFKTETRDDATLAKGTTKVVQEGKNGVRTVVYEKIYEDGVLKRSKVVSSTVTEEPVNKIVANGTYVAPASTSTPKSSSSGSSTVTKPTYCPNGTYTNAYGQTVCRPSSTNAGGATAVCSDGTYSYSKTRSGTCSHHGGVSRWL